MRLIHNSGLDLNLLKVFDAVMETRSASRAAARLGIGQSAVSHGLARLRAATGDALFVRSASGLEPTARAQRLAEPVREALLLATRALQPAAEASFDPAARRTEFRIGAGDYAASVLLRGLVTEIAEAGWDIGLAVQPVNRRSAPEAVDAGEIDLALGMLAPPRRWQERRMLYEEGHACLYDGARLGLPAPLPLADFARLPHILPSLHGEFASFVDSALEAQGLARRSILATAHFLAIPLLLKSVPAVATLPLRLSRLCANAAALTTSPLPFEAPRFEVSMLWHKRDTSVPALRWLRERLAAHNAQDQLFA
ncbi:LysR substrate-binding domain-containing protein [Falsiroseomonas tokyonensis]|uniref:LysR substrate-binding domain-containing protein n=1 Tax=Falsiroseomonas tokyonensis TaxID=430521 RepID=A0ABV7C425_9PROT|nr:LysR substrate-binding domain-containing protein [Falsiroseomonas tokyonensis]MBU8541389.1 LysR family transcriptional regulator [Falsiroseomonas tokyonensis]